MLTTCLTIFHVQSGFWPVCYCIGWYFLLIFFTPFFPFFPPPSLEGNGLSLCVDRFRVLAVASNVAHSFVLCDDVMYVKSLVIIHGVSIIPSCSFCSACHQCVGAGVLAGEAEGGEESFAARADERPSFLFI